MDFLAKVQSIQSIFPKLKKKKSPLQPIARFSDILRGYRKAKPSCIGLKGYPSNKSDKTSLSHT